LKEQYENLKNDTRFANDRKRWASNSKKFILAVFKTVILVGICYVILGRNRNYQQFLFLGFRLLQHHGLSHSAGAYLRAL